MCNYLWHRVLGRHLAAITDRTVSESTSPARFLERSSVVEATLDVKLEEFPDWKLAENTTEFLNPTVYRPGEASGFKYAIYFISSEKLTLLKRRISLNTPDLKLSTTEILSAFLWPHLVVARDINPQTYPEARLSLAVDARSRMKGPSVPHNYWGNFSEPNAVARLPVARLQNGSPFSSSSPPDSGWTAVYTHTARRIHDAIRAVDDNAVRRLVSLLNQMSKDAMLTWNVDRYPGPDMLIVCIRTHRFNDIHFGHELGYPSATRCTVGDTEGKPDGRCMILPPRRADGQGLEVLLQYDSDTLKRLDGNDEFGNFFVRRN
jgi:trichothecene 3-O-acetyltransferase